MYKSLAIERHLYVVSSSRKEFRMSADSLFMTWRSSAAVLQARMERIRSRSLWGGRKEFIFIKNLFLF